MITTELDSQISDIRQKILDNQREIISREHTIDVLIRRKSELQAERDRSTGLKVREVPLPDTCRACGCSCSRTEQRICLSEM